MGFLLSFQQPAPHNQNKIKQLTIVKLLTILNIMLLKPRGVVQAAVIILVGIALSACGSMGSGGASGINGLGNYDLSVVNGYARLSITFEDLQADVGARIPLQRPANAYIEIGPDFNSVGTLFVLTVPLASLYRDVGGLPLVGLPDGRPIPYIRNGLLGAAMVQLPIFGATYLYLAQDVFGIFIPVNLPDIPVMVTTRIRDEGGNVLGALVGIPRGRTGWISGILFLFPMNGGV